MFVCGYYFNKVMRTYRKGESGLKPALIDLAADITNQVSPSSKNQLIDNNLNL